MPSGTPLGGRMPFRAWRPDAAIVYLLMTSTDAFRQRLIYTVLAVYYVTAVGMDPLQLVLVGTVLEAATLIFEVPTDVYSRRLSIVLGHAIIGVAFVLEGSVPLFGLILLAEMLRAIGESCLSGATQAWLADEVEDDRLGVLFVRGAQLRRAFGLVGIAASVALASVDLTLPIVLGGGLSLALAGLLIVVMPERGFRPLRRTGSAGGLFRTAATGLGQFRQRPLLLIFLALAAAVGASSEGFDRLWEAHVLASFVFPDLGALEPVVWFGILEAGALLLGIVGVQALTRVDLTDDRVLARYGLFTYAGWLVAVCIFGLATDFAVAVLAYWAARVMKSLGQPIFDTWHTRSIPSQVRATVLSTLSQGDALGQMLGGPVIGLIGVTYSLRVAMVATGMFHAPALLLLSQARRVLDGQPRTSPPG